MKNVRQIKCLIFVLSALWALILLAQGIVVPLSFFKPLNYIVLAALMIIFAFDKWMWKWRPIRFIFSIHTPVLNGTWKGTLLSSWINPATGSGIPPINAFLSVTQTYSFINVKLLTRESSSDLLNGTIDENKGVFRLLGTYLNEPRMSVRDRSQIHFGSIAISVHEGNPPRLEGKYWTDRDTKGEMHFDQRINDLYTSFEDCEKAFANTGNQ
jgi:hypothetical protein